MQKPVARPSCPSGNSGTDGDTIREFDTPLFLKPEEETVFPTHYPVWAPSDMDSSITKERLPKIDPALWPEIARRAQSESLRELATTYSVSSETIRRILKTISSKGVTPWDT